MKNEIFSRMFNENKNEIKLRSLKDARKTAKSKVSVERFKPIRLKSLREARDLVKSKTQRPESVLSLPDKLIRSYAFDDKPRTVYSVSPEQDIEYSDSEHIFQNEPIKLVNDNDGLYETSPILITDLNIDIIPECEQETIRELETSIVEEEIEIKCIEKEQEIKCASDPTEISGLDTPNKIKKVCVKPEKVLFKKCIKPIKDVIKPKKPRGNVLNFIDDTKEEKKLTKSQQKVLLDRLQGTQFKFTK